MDYNTAAFMSRLSLFEDSNSTDSYEVLSNLETSHVLMTSSSVTHHRASDLRMSRMFRPSTQVPLWNLSRSIQYALLHSSGFISWPIFALLLIAEAKYDAPRLTPGKEGRHSRGPRVTAYATDWHFSEEDIKSPYHFQSVSACYWGRVSSAKL